MQHLSAVTLLVPDYDEAIAYYTKILGFQLRTDTPQGNGKRWVTVAPSDLSQTVLLLAKASTAEQLRHIGNQSGGRVFLFLHTDAFAADYARLTDAGVEFLEEPRHEPYGAVVVFRDKFGNLWDLLGLPPD